MVTVIDSIYVVEQSDFSWFLPLRWLYSGSSAHQGRFGSVWRCCGWRVLGREGTLVKTLQCTGQSPTTKNYPTQNVNSAEDKKPSFTFTMWYIAHVIMIWYASMWHISYKWKWIWYVMERDLVTTPSSVRWATNFSSRNICIKNRDMFLKIT